VAQSQTWQAFKLTVMHLRLALALFPRFRRMGRTQMAETILDLQKLHSVLAGKPIAELRQEAKKHFGVPDMSDEQFERTYIYGLEA
jgi:hypothetical protein